MKNKGSFIKKTIIALSIVIFMIQGCGFLIFISLTPDILLIAFNKKMVFYFFLYQVISLIAIMATVVILFNRDIKKPLGQVREALNEIKKGNLILRIKTSGCSEIMMVTEAVNSLIMQLRKNIYKLFLASRNLTTAIQQIKELIGNISERTNTQLSFTKKIISAIADINNSQKNILNSTHLLSEYSSTSKSSLSKISSTNQEVTKNTDQLIQSSENIYLTITEMTEAVKAIARSSENLSISLDQTTVSIAEITANLKEVEKNTKESADLTSKVREVASGAGMLTVADAIEGMEEITKSVVNNRELIRQLGIKSKEIEKVLSVITEVAKQTNLLSLNAAILASQAGEYGKSFSVVADEIRTLADKTASSVKEITAIIRGFQKEIASVIEGAEECLQLSEKGTTLVIETGEAFREVIDFARNSAELAKMIQRATEEQVRAITQINDSMDMVQRMVEDVTKATHEQEQSSEEIINTIEKIKEISENMKGDIKEQNTEIVTISKNIELTDGKIKHIVTISSQQENSHKDLLSSMEKLKTLCDDTITVSQEVMSSFNILYEEAKNLIRGIEGFRIE